MKVYVIVVTYNASNWIEKCLESIRASSIPVQILVIDNLSRDHTIQIIREKFSTAEIIINKSNLGFGRANNIGIRYALKENPNYIFLMNQDARVEKYTIESLIEISGRNPNYAILSPIHLNGDGTTLDYSFSIYASPENCKNFLSDLFLKRKDLDEVYKINFVNAAFWLVPSKFFLIIGGFDPVFPHYGEDGDLVNRIHFHGLEVGITPKVVGFHDRVQGVINFKNLSLNKKIEKLRSTYLLKIKDININIIGCVFNLIKVLIKDTYKAVASFDLKALLVIYWVSFVLILKMPIILRNRKICKQNGSHFI